MSGQTWVQTLISAQSAGTPLTDSTTPTSILPSQAKYTFPPDILAIGNVFRITGAGQVSNVATTPGTLTLDIRFGAVIVFTGAIQFSTVAGTNVPVWWKILLTARAVGGGTSANFMGQGIANAVDFTRTTTNSTADVPFPTTAPAVGTGFDSTAANIIDQFATFSVSTDPTSITLQQWSLEYLN